MTFDREAFLRRFWQMDAALVAAGFPATSPWWRAQIDRFLRSGRRRWIVRAGRRAGKSTTLCRLAVAWAWFGAWSVPPGDTAVIPFVSVGKDEAGARLRTITAILKALGLTFEPRGDELELTSPNRVFFKTLACTTSAVVGFTSISVFADEVARWEARDTSANPAKEVFGSLAPTLATQPNSFAVLCSSPWSTDDYHAWNYDRGDTDDQVVSFATTWEANPTITEEQTHELEADPRVWSREYAAAPGETVSAALDPVDVASCFGRTPSGSFGRGFVAIDASSLRGDAFAWVAGRETTGGELAIIEVGGIEGDELRRVSMEEVVARVAAKCTRFGTTIVYGDQREEAALRSLFAQRGVILKSFAWSLPSKDAAVQSLRRLMRERKLLLPAHDKIRQQLGGMKARLMPSGRVAYDLNGLDYASALVTLCHAVVERSVLPMRGGNDVPCVLPSSYSSNSWI